MPKIERMVREKSKPLSRWMAARVPIEDATKIEKIAKSEQCGLSDVIRTAIRAWLKGVKA